MAKDLAIVLNNGSLASAVTTALAAQHYRPIMLHISTTGDAPSPWQQAYEQQVAFFKPFREHTLAMDFLHAVWPAQTQPALAADARAGAALQPRLLKLMTLISLGTRYAVHYHAKAVYLGLRVGSATDDLIRATEYGQIWNELIQLSCEQKEVELIMPLLELELWQMVDVGVQVNAPLDKTWSCLSDTTEPCWVCQGCRAREAAFQRAVKLDPLHVAKSR